jgi:hypothetical protein
MGGLLGNSSTNADLRGISWDITIYYLTIYPYDMY